jgi:uncharacterized membrane protein YtjA (UPF0391 family)
VGGLYLEQTHLKADLYQYILPVSTCFTRRAEAGWHLLFNHMASGNEAASNARETDSAAGSGRRERRNKMLYYALVFLLIAIVAAVLGFGGVAVISAGIAKILFFIFIVLFLVSLITHMSRRV